MPPAGAHKHKKDGSTLLAKKDIAPSLKDIPEWRVRPGGKEIERAYRMKDFSEAARLISAVAGVADELDHHPDVLLEGYRRLTFRLSTHDAGGVTSKDVELAYRIESLPKETEAGKEET